MTTLMARWDHGYVTDVAYTISAYQETTPSWLAACSTLLGFLPTDTAKPFRYADLGCGNGLTTLLTAATSPHAEVWGFDFNPAHVEQARAMAARSGLTNIHFEETSFEALAKADAAGDFDIMVSHGVLSWISLENRRHLLDIIGRRLRPGGLAYLSYNTTTGWSGMEPVRLLMRQLAQSSQRRSDQAVETVFGVLEQLRAGGAMFFQAHPGLQSRLDQMKNQDARYIAHEFLNRDWHPVMFAELLEAMAETRTTFIGSATLTENIDAVSVPQALLPLLADVRDLGIRETIRDLASSKAFRRDLWRKGGERMAAPEHTAHLDALTLIWTGKPPEDTVTFPSPVGTVTGQPEFYRPLLDAIRAGPVTIGALRALPALQGRQIGEFVQAASLLIAGGHAHPGLPGGGRAEARAATARLNGAIVDRIRMGVDLQRLAAPVIGSSVPVSVVEALVTGQLLEEPARSRAALTDEALNALSRSGRSLQKDGQTLTDPAAAHALVSEVVRAVVEERLPLLRVLGVVV